MIKFILQKADYEVIEAVNGEEALAKAGSELPDLILMDMQLPVMNGYEATAKIKADEKTRNIPVFALTAYAMRGDEEKSLQAGCDAYLKKPVDPENIVQEIETLLEKFTKSGGKDENSDC